jgi:tripartite-type tricarboxylate transporter receptor subunit TctC
MFRLQWLAGTCAGLLIAGAPALGQGYPSKPVRIIVPFAPGGGTDVAARALSTRLGEGLGQPVLVENRPGANSHLGSRSVVQSPADGYTLLLTAVGTIAVSPHLQKLEYDPVTDLAPVALVGFANLAIAVNASMPIQSLADLVKYSNQAPKGIFYSVSALGTMPHLAAELFKVAAKTNWSPVVYKGAGPAAAALAAGEVPASLIDVTSLLPHSASGRIRILAVTGAKRAVSAPQVPTVAESGYPGYAADAWVAIFAPAATPADIIARLNTEIGRTLSLADVQKIFLQTGTETATMSPDELRRYVADQYQKWGKVIRDANIKLE